MKGIVEFIKGFDLHNIIIVGLAFWWLRADINPQLEEIRKEIYALKEDVSLIKTILITKGIMPECFAKDVKPLDKDAK